MSNNWQSYHFHKNMLLELILHVREPGHVTRVSHRTRQSQQVNQASSDGRTSIWGLPETCKDSRSRRSRLAREENQQFQSHIVLASCLTAALEAGAEAVLGGSACCMTGHATGAFLFAWLIPALV